MDLVSESIDGIRGEIGVDPKGIVGLHASRSSVPPSYTEHASLAPFQRG
ncbi:uncharacterized protein FFB20_12424 [Fusarium fujikuroi]|nr:uncharacterized protein FFB20_12424 [Fusarium fujikuroi]SCO11786.1 uncharacterized protein FFC1_11591 [Fusarium fujikuroi]SCO14235.1 uncharacterized protein FFE2_13100 [Fusarium fujikuroi]SCO19011.1 uncharacterized protein FFM5_12027 [Fusarium fujikuroi]SCO40444.1 uncharacterized protein FFNC_07486 [Fusarium fujikuroi]